MNYSSGKQKHILLVIEGGYPWYYGGVSEWTSQYLRHLTDTNFTILQVATKPWQNISLDRAIYPMAENVISFRQVAPPEIYNGSMAQLHDWAQNQIDSLDDLVKPDLIHITNTGLAGLLGTKLRNIYNIPSILTEHAIYWKEIQRGAQALECGFDVDQYGEPSRVQALFRQLARHTYNHADKIVSVSRSNIHWQHKLGAENVEYIPNGVAGSQLVEQKNFSGNRKMNVGWIGRCADIKNPLKFLQIAQQMKNHFEIPLAFTMLLSETEEKQLQLDVNREARKIQNLDIHWNQPAHEYLDNMDMLLLTSRSESQPLVLLEALAHRVLPFGWKIGDADANYGIFMEPGKSIECLLDEIEKRWEQPNVWRKEVESRFHFIKENHLWHHIFTQYKEHISNLTDVTQL